VQDKGHTPRDPDFAAKVRESFARQGIMAHLGAKLERIEPGFVEISLPFSPKLTQQHGYFHAGTVATVADSAGGYAAFSLFPAGSSILAIEFKMNFIAPADGVRIWARGRVLRSGRTITVCQLEADVETKDGRRVPCMAGMQTNIRLPDTPDRPSG
jgi:uncharacterized protein (TIGR00369 family)